MGNELNLLKALPTSKRDVQAREGGKNEAVIAASKEYGELYFDGPRDYGYGGYRYDGRWRPVARDIADHFGLSPGDRLLDVGCAKGFLVKDFLEIDIDAYGIDVSRYALMHCEPEVVGHLQIGSADDLPFPDGSFDAVIAINSIHNLPRDRCKIALQEIERLAPGKGYVQVDSYRTPEQKAIFESWVLTAEFHDYPEVWIQLFAEAGYTGDYNWTIME